LHKQGSRSLVVHRCMGGIRSLLVNTLSIAQTRLQVGDQGGVDGQDLTCDASDRSTQAEDVAIRLPAVKGHADLLPKPS